MKITNIHITSTLRIALFSAAALFAVGAAAPEAAAGPNCHNPTRTLVPGHINRQVTTIAIQRNNTVALGGLTGEKNVAAQDEIPHLGDIPAVGKLFKNKGTAREKRSLLIFITPRIVRSDDA